MNYAPPKAYQWYKQQFIMEVSILTQDVKLAYQWSEWRKDWAVERQDKWIRAFYGWPNFNVHDERQGDSKLMWF